MCENHYEGVDKRKEILFQMGFQLNGKYVPKNRNKSDVSTSKGQHLLQRCFELGQTLLSTTCFSVNLRDGFYERRTMICVESRNSFLLNTFIRISLKNCQKQQLSQDLMSFSRILSLSYSISLLSLPLLF